MGQRDTDSSNEPSPPSSPKMEEDIVPPVNTDILPTSFTLHSNLNDTLPSLNNGIRFISVNEITQDDYISSSGRRKKVDKPIHSVLAKYKEKYNGTTVSIIRKSCVEDALQEFKSLYPNARFLRPDRDNKKQFIVLNDEEISPIINNLLSKYKPDNTTINKSASPDETPAFSVEANVITTTDEPNLGAAIVLQKMSSLDLCLLLMPILH